MDIFVGNLPFKLKENELREVFSKYGEVTSVKIIINKATHMKKGFAFVEMPNEAQALEAIEALNQTKLMERTIEVHKAEGKKQETNKSGKDTTESEKEQKKFNVWARKLYPKKQKPKVVDYPEMEQKKSKKIKGGGLKSARNFKVGSRKKK